MRGSFGWKRAMGLLALASCGAGSAGEPRPDDAFDAGPGDTSETMDATDAARDGRADEPSPCIPSAEACNERDDDCDGNVDEDFNLQDDPAHCGRCELSCGRTNMAGACQLSACVFECLSGFRDLDSDLANGCEYRCIPSPGLVEACDGLDNDCDGEIDEDTDLQADPRNCGRCGRPCVALHAEPACLDGECNYGACEAGYGDALEGVPGCEYRCPLFPAEPESCNGVDDDCDGSVDEGNPGGGLACSEDAGACLSGTLTCLFGALTCVGAVGPSIELCNDLDDDCDGTTDEDFDKLTDPRTCGGCTRCDFANAAPRCERGACSIAACYPGFLNLNGDAEDGCEYACIPSGAEVCDGRDNDCDRLVDGNDPDLLPPTNFCETRGACAGTTASCAAGSCDSTVRWRCNYGGDTERDTCNRLATEEARCDGVDGDCDGNVDEPFAGKGDACSNGAQGECQATGVFACDASGTALECEITHAGRASTAEVCNGMDDDCDGDVDEDAPDDMVHVVSGTRDYWIYRYEASRPDAAALSQGVMRHRACSRAGVLPWSNVTLEEAGPACAAAGLRLCTEGEWQEACEGPARTTWPYGNTYDANACNGNDYDPDCSGPDDDRASPTGASHQCNGSTAPRCESAWHAFDLSGNLAEWTATEIAGAVPTYRIRGGAFDNVAAGSTCQFDFVSAVAESHYENLGFRCCSDEGP